MSRRKKEESRENHERWLITYADLITLLMVFFVVMYAMSQLEKMKFNELILSLRNAFRGDIIFEESGSTGIIGRNSDSVVREQEMKEFADFLARAKQRENGEQEAQGQGKNGEFDELKAKLKRYIEEHQLTGVVELVEVPRGIQISIKDRILFDLGSARLKPEAIPVLDTIAGLLKALPNAVSIEGHTDDYPIIYHTKYRSNWDLSADRALSVLYFLTDEKGLDPQRFRVVGFGEYQPRFPNDTAEHRAANRRVDIVVLR
ncbi:flagellar motor protein MotB [Bacillaceae bacterium]